MTRQEDADGDPRDQTSQEHRMEDDVDNKISSFAGGSWAHDDARTTGTSRKKAVQAPVGNGTDAEISVNAPALVDMPLQGQEQELENHASNVQDSKQEANHVVPGRAAKFHPEGHSQERAGVNIPQQHRRQG